MKPEGFVVRKKLSRTSWESIHPIDCFEAFGMYEKNASGQAAILLITSHMHRTTAQHGSLKYQKRRLWSS